MPFSAVTCLTYTGTTTLGGVLNLYSDTDSYTTPFKSGINLSAITGNQCPYYISDVPDGTTQIRILDTLTGCHCDIPVQSNDLCVTCDLDFNLYDNSTIGRIVAGNLTGTCQSNITDYRIFWYETGDTTNPVYISGKGTEYQPYAFTHPLTGTSSIFAQAGTYVPVIDKVKISGLTFSQTGGTGNIPAELDCFGSTEIIVDAFTCGNGDSSDLPYYEHRVNFLSASAGSAPQSLEGTFLFTGITDYFAWKFKGFSVFDRLRLTYIGSAYDEELLIEDIQVGSGSLSENYSLNSFPKTSRMQNENVYLKKVTCLTGITRTPGDSIKIEVIPNQTVNETTWDFYFTCLTGFNQNTCITNANPYKIVTSSIDSQTGSCLTTFINFTLSGACKRNDDDFSTYMITDNGDGNNFWYDFRAFSNGVISWDGQFSFNTISANIYGLNFGRTCATQSTNTISFMKYVSASTYGVIDMTFSNVNDFNAYYNSFLLVSTGTSITSCVGAYSGTPYDNTDLRYYRHYELSIPTNTGSSLCGSDGSTFKTYYLHTSTQVTTGFTGLYTLRFTMPTVTKGLFITPLGCDVDLNVSVEVNLLNSSSTGSTNNYTGTTTSGSRYTFPFTSNYVICSGTTPPITAFTVNGIVRNAQYHNETIVYTGTTPTMVPSLSAKTFNYDTTKYSYNPISLNLSYYERYMYYYIFRSRNTADRRDFDIFASTFTGTTLGSETLIYSYTGSTNTGTIYDNSYFI
jgi:hypothetical protein